MELPAGASHSSGRRGDGSSGGRALVLCPQHAQGQRGESLRNACLFSAPSPRLAWKPFNEQCLHRTGPWPESSAERQYPSGNTSRARGSTEKQTHLGRWLLVSFRTIRRAQASRGCVPPSGSQPPPARLAPRSAHGESRAASVRSRGKARACLLRLRPGPP